MRFKAEFKRWILFRIEGLRLQQGPCAPAISQALADIDSEFPDQEHHASAPTAIGAERIESFLRGLVEVSTASLKHGRTQDLPYLLTYLPSTHMIPDISHTVPGRRDARNITPLELVVSPRGSEPKRYLIVSMKLYSCCDLARALVKKHDRTSRSGH